MKLKLFWCKHLSKFAKIPIKIRNFDLFFFKFRALEKNSGQNIIFPGQPRNFSAHLVPRGIQYCQTGELKLSYFQHDLRRWRNKEKLEMTYRIDPKFSDRCVLANSADPDQTAPRGAVWSGFTLFAIPSVSFGLITLLSSHIVQILVITTNCLGVRIFRKFMVVSYKNVHSSVCKRVM